MATLNFPDSPSTGDVYRDSNSGFSYEWNGSVWISIEPSTASNIREIDDISGSFNGSTTAFTLQVSGFNIEPDNVQQLIISVGGVMQNAGDDYTVDGSTITFTTAPSSGLTFFGTYLGTALSINTVADGSVSPSSFTTTTNYRMGGLTVDQSAGIITAYQFQGNGSLLTGVATTDNIITNTDAVFNANVSIAGSLTVQGTETIINVDELNVQDKTIGIGSTSSPSSTTQDGAGAIIYGQTNVTILYDTDKAALGISTAVNVVGFITATSFYGDGSNLTGVGATLYPLTYHPGISSTGQPFKVADNNYIELEWSFPIKAGTGTIELRSGSASGTVVDQFVVGTSNSITIANNVLTMTPAVGLNTGTNYFVVIPANAIKSLGDQQQNSVINDYSYTTNTKKDMELWVWGDNEYGGLGENDAENLNRSSPVQIGTDTNWWKMGGSYRSPIGLKNDGTLWGWGGNVYGQLGLNESGPAPGGNTEYSSPTQIGTDTNWEYIMDAYHTSYTQAGAVKSDGTLWMWGVQGPAPAPSGKLGLNDNVDRSSPTQVGTDTTWTRDGDGKLIGDWISTSAIKTDGTLWSWGTNTNGILGLNESPSPTFKRSSPCQVGTDTTWKSIRPCGDYNRVALKTNGTLWSWGNNENGVLGLNQGHDIGLYSSPTQIGTDTTWSILSAGEGQGLTAIKTDGTLWAWGLNESLRAIGPGVDVSSFSSPTQVGTDTTWASTFTFLTGNGWIGSKTDGTLWSSGSYLYNGQNTSSGEISSPTQIGTYDNWKKINGEALDSTSFNGVGDPITLATLPPDE